MTNSDEARVVDAVPTGLFIGGEWRPAASGAALVVDDPATGKALCEVADAGPADGMEALAAACAAQQPFAAMAPRERGEILRRAYELMMARIDDLALLMTLEMGKPIAESKGEITYAAEFFRWFAEEAVRIDGGYAVAPNGASRFLVQKQPVGVSLLITPWNFPAAMGTRKIGPAVAAGCAMVLKPAAQTPLSMHALAAILTEAGLPPGVLNLVTTSDAGGVMEPLIRDGRARKLSFTGSTAVGRLLLEQASEKVLRTSMELGGNAPFLVFGDADLDKAVEGAMLAKMRNMGEACTAANRFLVHRSVAQAFAGRLAERMGALKVGRGTEDRCAGRAAGGREGPRQGHRPRPGRPRPRGTRARRRRPGGRAGLLLPADRALRRTARRRGSAPRRSSARSRPSPSSTTRTRRSPRPTTPSSGWSATSSRRT